MTNIYVGNLPYDVGDSELQALFEPFGEVRSAKVIMDRETDRPRGFGFVEMGSSEEADQAISELNGHELQGRQLNVNEARERSGGDGGGFRRF